MHLGLKRLSAALVFVGASFMPGWAREAAFTCPAGFIPKEGLNTNFPSDGLMRAFVVTPGQRTGAGLGTDDRHGRGDHRQSHIATLWRDRGDSSRRLHRDWPGAPVRKPGSGYRVLLEPVRIRLNQGPQVHYTRPAADPLFVSAAEAYGERVIGIVLSGGGSDGAIGLQAIKEHGGIALVQHPEDAAVPFMPRAAIAAVHPDACRPVQEIAQLVRSFCSR
jgi:hypothetical protein